VSAPFTSDLAASLSAGLLDRFCRYVAVETQSTAPREGSPSTPGQLELGRMLVAELRTIGLADAAIDDMGYVFATLPATVDHAPTVGVIAHLDTSPDAPGAGVTPLVHRDYDGGVIELPRAGTRLDPASMPELAARIGHDLVTASGDTLLGADDKAGVAAIVTAVAHLAASPELPRPAIRVGFTPDEEIGEGARLFDIERFGARCAYTIDGSGLGELQDESFSALEAVVRIDGFDIHPGQASGRMVSALRLAAEIVADLPDDRLTPTTSSGREGFIHPVRVTASPAHAEIRLILRDFDEELLASHAALLRETAARVVEAHPPARLTVDVRRQYRNMRDYIERDPAVVEAAIAAMRAEGIEPVRTPIRGGTDGSLLSEMGLPTPNIFDGGHEYHSVREWASVQEMAAAAATIIRLAEVWSRRSVDSGEAVAA
jgi:tripeptide aminopeptidase